MSDVPTAKALAAAQGVVLAARRKDRGWSQSELAERAKLHPKTVATYEQGARMAPFPVLVTLCKKLGANVAEVVAAIATIAEGSSPCPTCEGTGVKPKRRRSTRKQGQP